MAIRVGVSVFPWHARGGLAALSETWRALDELGVDIVFAPDHFFPPIGDPQGRSYECLTLLVAVAGATERALIGPFVLADAFRNPHLVADMARTLDHLAGGRFVLGLGAGGNERDHREYGYPFGTGRTRVEALARSVPAIRDRLARLVPPPLGRIPILIGGSGPRLLRITAEHADLWHTLGGATELGRESAVLDAWCRQLGRDPAEIERAVRFAPDEPDCDPDVLAGLGASLFVLAITPGDGLERVRELLRWRDRRNATVARG